MSTEDKKKPFRHWNRFGPKTLSFAYAKLTKRAH